MIQLTLANTACKDGPPAASSSTSCLVPYPKRATARLDSPHRTTPTSRSPLSIRFDALSTPLSPSPLTFPLIFLATKSPLWTLSIFLLVAVAAINTYPCFIYGSCEGLILILNAVRRQTSNMDKRPCPCRQS